MLGTQDLALFVVAGLLLNVTPGPDTLYIVGRSSTQGLRAGVVPGRAAAWFHRAVGAIFVVLGVRLALSRN